MSEDLLEVGLTQEKPVRPKKTKQQIQEENQIDTSILVPPSHLGFDRNGKCLTCGLKKMTSLTGYVYCPVELPECPRNIKE